MFNIPIIFIFFKRKETTIKAFEQIKKIKPKKLYLFQDGARNDEEKLLIKNLRKEVLSMIDWKCDLKLLFQKNNLGFHRHVPLILNNFFEENDYGIYLEDDIVASEDFFYYQEEILKKYKDNKKIFGVNGMNLFPDKLKNKD
jgi:hypothetical protein